MEVGKRRQAGGEVVLMEGVVTLWEEVQKTQVQILAVSCLVRKWVMGCMFVKRWRFEVVVVWMEKCEQLVGKVPELELVRVAVLVKWMVATRWFVDKGVVAVVVV